MIVNVAAAHDSSPHQFKSAYVASKHGRAGADEGDCSRDCRVLNYRQRHLSWLHVFPLVEKQMPATAKARGITQDEVVKNVLFYAQPTHQFVTPEEIGALALFLYTNAAASISAAALPNGWRNDDHIIAGGSCRR